MSISLFLVCLCLERPPAWDLRSRAGSRSSITSSKEESSANSGSSKVRRPTQWVILLLARLIHYTMTPITCLAIRSCDITLHWLIFPSHFWNDSDWGFHSDFCRTYPIRCRVFACLESCSGSIPSSSIMPHGKHVSLQTIVVTYLWLASRGWTWQRNRQDENCCLYAVCFTRHGMEIYPTNWWWWWIRIRWCPVNWKRKLYKWEIWGIN